MFAAPKAKWQPLALTALRLQYSDDGEQSLEVRLIRVYHRSDPDIRDGPVMSISSGPKDYVKNQICSVFEQDLAIEDVSVVRANGPMFIIMRKGSQYFDVSGREVEVQVQK
jgi:hypothetical protein